MQEHSEGSKKLSVITCTFSFLRGWVCTLVFFGYSHIEIIRSDHCFVPGFGNCELEFIVGKASTESLNNCICLRWDLIWNMQFLCGTRSTVAHQTAFKYNSYAVVTVVFAFVSYYVMSDFNWVHCYAYIMLFICIDALKCMVLNINRLVSSDIDRCVLFIQYEPKRKNIRGLNSN